MTSGVREDAFRGDENLILKSAHKFTCVLCGRKGMLHGRLRRLEQPETFQVKRKPQKTGEFRVESHKFPAGIIICKEHESFEQYVSRGNKALDEGKTIPSRRNKFTLGEVIQGGYFLEDIQKRIKNLTQI